MFAYCNNNPVNNYDDTGCLLQAIRDKVVHNMVLYIICGKNSELKMDETCVYYNGESWLGGFGFCDLYNIRTGEVWELKKSSNSYSCTTAAAQVQLGNYLLGKLKYHNELNLVLPYETVISEGTFDFTDGYYYYHVNYWYEGYGILRYNYSYTNTEKGLALEFAYSAAIAIAYTYYNAKAQQYGLPQISG